MKKIIIYLFICAAIVAGCENSVDVVITEQLLAEVSGDSIGTGGSGFASRTQTVSSSSLDFTNADSMRIKITFWGSTNNDTSNAIRIGYIQSLSPQVYVFNYTIPNTSVSTTETTLDVTLPSPNVNKSFIYDMNYLNSDGTGGFLQFKDLKIYKK